jgi:hypothetical protein
MRQGLCAVLLGGVALAGCGKTEPYKYEAETERPETAYANSVYTRLLDMKRANAAEGPQNVDTIGYLEGIEGHKDAAVGEHGPTYEEIHAGVRELQSAIQSGASRADVAAKIDALIAKAENLPRGATPARAVK